jgi:hypothetical protein
MSRQRVPFVEPWNRGFHQDTQGLESKGDQSQLCNSR